MRKIQMKRRLWENRRTSWLVQAIEKFIFSSMFAHSLLAVADWLHDDFFHHSVALAIQIFNYDIDQKSKWVTVGCFSKGLVMNERVYQSFCLFCANFFTCIRYWSVKWICCSSSGSIIIIFRFEKIFSFSKLILFCHTIQLGITGDWSNVNSEEHHRQWSD